PRSQAAGIGEASDRFEQTVARPAGGLQRARAVKGPHRGIFVIPAEVFDDLGLTAKTLRRLIPVQPDVFELALGHKQSSLMGPNRKWNRPSNLPRKRRLSPKGSLTHRTCAAAAE